jgi:hypothetical protein
VKLLTPLRVSGSEGGTLLENSPRAGVMESGFLLTDIVKVYNMIIWYDTSNLNVG